MIHTNKILLCYFKLFVQRNEFFFFHEAIQINLLQIIFNLVP
jgi:hypothetical protein